MVTAPPLRIVYFGTPAFAVTSAGDDACCCTQTVALYRAKLARIDLQLGTLAQLRGRIEERIALLEPC